MSLEWWNPLLWFCIVGATLDFIRLCKRHHMNSMPHSQESK